MTRFILAFSGNYTSELSTKKRQEYLSRKPLIGKAGLNQDIKNIYQDMSKALKTYEQKARNTSTGNK